MLKAHKAEMLTLVAWTEQNDRQRNVCVRVLMSVSQLSATISNMFSAGGLKSFHVGNCCWGHKGAEKKTNHKRSEAQMSVQVGDVFKCKQVDVSLQSHFRFWSSLISLNRICPASAGRNSCLSHPERRVGPLFDLGRSPPPPASPSNAWTCL